MVLNIIVAMVCLCYYYITCYTDSYEDAKSQLSIAEFTSDMSSSENKKTRKVRRKRPCDSDVNSIIVKHKKKVLPKSVKEKSSNNLWNVLSTDGSSSKIYMNYKIMFLVN